VEDLLGRMVPSNVRVDLQTSDFDRLKEAFFLDFPGAQSRLVFPIPPPLHTLRTQPTRAAASLGGVVLCRSC